MCALIGSANVSICEIKCNSTGGRVIVSIARNRIGAIVVLVRYFYNVPRVALVCPDIRSYVVAAKEIYDLYLAGIGGIVLKVSVVIRKISEAIGARFAYVPVSVIIYILSIS